jgi:hypothetical protein
MSSAAETPIERDDMKRVYAMVLVCHTVVITALWLFGRIFSS